jgi:arylsulfatase A-like enzyme
VPPSDLHSVEVGGLKPGTVSNTLPVYKAMIQAMDTEIGRLLKAVDMNETVVIYIGDNGTPVIVKDTNAGVRGSKQSVYEGGVRVPIVIAGAGVTRKNAREDALVVSTDLFDTIAALADIPADAINAQVNNSFNLVPLFTQGGASTGRDYSFSELCGPQGRRFAVRDTRYKLLSDNGQWGLYDLQSDPMESKNLYGQPAVAAAQAGLAARIASLKAAAKFGCFQ